MNKRFNHNVPDCALIVSGKQIYCHKFILSQRCPILHEMIAAEERPQPQSEYHSTAMIELFLPKIRFEVGEAMVRFLYTDYLFGGKFTCINGESFSSFTSLQKLIPSIVFFQDVFRAAKDFQLIRLMHFCEKIMDYYNLEYDRCESETEYTRNERNTATLSSDLGMNLLQSNNHSLKPKSSHVQLVASGKSIQVHLCLLSTRSLYFQNIFSSAKEEDRFNNMSSSLSSIEIPCTFSAMIRFTYFLYTGTLPTNIIMGSSRKTHANSTEKKTFSKNEGKGEDIVFQEQVENLRSAHFFQVLDMKDHCEACIKVTRENVGRIFDLAVEVNSARLKEEALYALSSNLGDEIVLDQLRELSTRHEHLMSEIFERIKNSEASRTKGGAEMGFQYGYDMLIPREFQRDWLQVEKFQRQREKKKQERIMKEMLRSHWFDFQFKLDAADVRKDDTHEFSLAFVRAWIRSLLLCFWKTRGGKIIVAVIMNTIIQRQIKLRIWIFIANALFLTICGAFMIRS